MFCLFIAVGGFGFMFSPPSVSARQPNHQPLFQLFEGHFQNNALRLAIPPKPAKLTPSPDTFFPSMPWKSSGEPGSVMI
jgi:hypothetical protein